MFEVERAEGLGITLFLKVDTVDINEIEKL